MRQSLNLLSFSWGLSWFSSVPPDKCQDSTLKLGHGHFLPNLFNTSFTYDPFIWHDIVLVTEKVLLNNLQTISFIFILMSYHTTAVPFPELFSGPLGPPHEILLLLQSRNAICTSHSIITINLHWVPYKICPQPVSTLESWQNACTLPCRQGFC
jgi:hypothetical protein